MRVAAVTMTYNEPDFVPIWTRHYARHVGAENCFVLDHGSDDGSTDGLSANVIRLDRSPFDEPSRRRTVGAFCASLLQDYDFVVSADVDEIVLPDPRRFATIAEYCAQPRAPATSAIGLNVQHVPSLEPPLDLSRPITAQRRHVWFGSPMCKPLLIRAPVTWCEGGHACEHPPAFDGLYMFHLRWYDLRLALRRVAKTRAMPWSDAPTGAGYQRMDDAAFTRLFMALASRWRLPRVSFQQDAPGPLRDLLQQVAQSWSPDVDGQPSMDLLIAGREMWPIPRYFQGAF